MRIHPKTAMSNDRRDFGSSDFPSADSLQRSIEACRQERIQNGLDPDTGAFPESPEETLARTLDRLNIPGAQVIKMPVTDNIGVHRLQLREAQDVDVVAEQIADTAYSVTHLTELDRAKVHTVRCLATHALRSLKPAWVKVAQEAAVEAGVMAMKDAGFAHLGDERLAALSRLLVGHITTAYMSVTEGTATITPAQYLSVITGGGK